MSSSQWRAVVMAVLVLSGRPALRSRVPPHQQTGVLEGRVVVGDDKPIRRAQVTVSGPMTLVTDTDPEGVFHLEGLIKGTYTIAPTKPGFVQLLPSKVTVGDRSGVTPITVRMAVAGAITGRVLDRAGAIIPDAPVTLLSNDASVSQQLTDDRGVFRFHTLRDGTYAVWAQTLDRNEAQTVTLADARTVDLQIVLHYETPVDAPPPPAGPPEPLAPGTRAIMGVVTSAETGRPMGDVEVLIGDATSGSRLTRNERTNAAGRFIFRDVADGRYNLMAVGPAGYAAERGDRGTPVTINAGHPVAVADIALSALKVLSGRIVDEFGDPAPDVSVLSLQSGVMAGRRILLPMTAATTNDLGEFRIPKMLPGAFYVMALSGPFARAIAGPAAPPVYGYGFAPTFFPGTPAPDDAQPVRVENGKAIEPILFQLVPSGMGTVIGQVRDRTGAPLAGANVMLLQLHDGDLRTMVPARATTDTNGGFRINNVHTGSFVAQAFGRESFASEILSVAAGQTTEIGLSLKPSAAIRGRFVFDGPHDAALVKSIRILPTPTDFVHGPSGGGPTPFVVYDDGTFDVPRVIGFNRLEFALPLPWTLISMSSAGQDVTDRTFDWRDGDVDDLQVRLAPLATTVAGSVMDSNGRPVGNGFVLIVPQDSARWYWSRYLRGLTTNANGEFSTTGVPAGAYRAIPFAAVPRPDWMSSDFLEAVRGQGQGFTIGPGETITIRLEVRK